MIGNSACPEERKTEFPDPLFIIYVTAALSQNIFIFYANMSSSANLLYASFRFAQSCEFHPAVGRTQENRGAIGEDCASVRDSRREQLCRANLKVPDAVRGDSGEAESVRR